ncbi:MAG: hypothetical protein JXJ22_14975 [Bacteroidales bacterium]|nr:hypothetical protein [Bacteroidales bacterium]
MDKQKSKNLVKLTKSKKLLFNLILISIPIFIFVFFELVLRVINYGDNLNLFTEFLGEEYKEYKIVNPVIGKKYFKKLPNTAPRHDMFLEEKPSNGFRIFVMGSSTVYGFPYEENLLFSRILQERLQDCYPDKYIEVINTAITAINSYTLLDFIDEILDEEPDAILLYAGHNEFYGAFGIGSIEKTIKSRALTFFHLDLLSFKFYQLLRNTINKINGIIVGNKPEEFVKGTLMKVIVDNKEIPYKSEIYNEGIEIFKKNIDDLLNKAKKKNVKFFISELISNVRDLKPFCSVATSQYPSASEVFYTGKKNEQEGLFETAKENYYLAKDLDCVRFRASEEINVIIRKLAAKYDARLVPMISYFEKASPNMLIGNNLLTEHVHPNMDGYFIMADAFFNELVKSKLIGEKLNPVYYKNSAYYKRNWGYTELDSLVGVHMVNSLRSYWPFRPLDESSDKTYLDTYKPTSYIDSLAFEVFKTTIKINEAHLTLAHLFKSKGDFYNAFREYHAAIKYYPYRVKDYLEAATCLMHNNDLTLALKFINKSLELHETFFAYFYKSEILFIKGNYAEAGEALNKASELDNSLNAKEKVLKKLHKVYFYSGNDIKSQEILEELRKIHPGYQPIFPQKKNYAYYVPVQVKGQIDRALDFYKVKNFDAALDEFLKSLEVKETFIANRCIGDILFTSDDSSSIVYYQKAYPGYKNNADFLLNLGILYLQNRLTDKAQAVLEEIKRLDPNYKNIPLLEKNIQAQSLLK